MVKDRHIKIVVLAYITRQFEECFISFLSFHGLYKLQDFITEKN